MRKIILVLILAAVSVISFSCRESTREKTEEAAKAVGEDIEEGAERAVKETGEAIKEGADELNDELQGNDDL